MFITLFCLNLVLLIFVAIPYLRLESWWIRVFDFPRLQTFVLGGLLLVAELVLLDLGQANAYMLLAMTGIFLALQGWWIVPYTRLQKPEVVKADAGAEQPRLSILCCNVLTPNRNAAAVRERVQQWQPDIFVTLESDAWWENELTPLESQYPYSIKCPLDNLYGMHVYSKKPFIDSRLEFLVEQQVPSIHVLIEAGGQPVRLHFLHPAPPSPTENEESTERDGELMMVARFIKKNLKYRNRPTVVAGDLNDVAWSATTRLFRKVSGLLDPRVGRGMFNSFHAKWWFARWPLDHVFHSDHFTLVKMCRLPSVGSDHFPIYTELQFAPGRQNEQNGLELDDDEKAWAYEKISQVTDSSPG